MSTESGSKRVVPHALHACVPHRRSWSCWSVAVGPAGVSDCLQNRRVWAKGSGKGLVQEALRACCSDWRY